MYTVIKFLCGVPSHRKHNFEKEKAQLQVVTGWLVSGFVEKRALKLGHIAATFFLFSSLGSLCTLSFPKPHILVAAPLYLLHLQYP